MDPPLNGQQNVQYSRPERLLAAHLRDRVLLPQPLAVQEAHRDQSAAEVAEPPYPAAAGHEPPERRGRVAAVVPELLVVVAEQPLPGGHGDEHVAPRPYVV